MLPLLCAIASAATEPTVIADVTEDLVRSSDVVAIGRVVTKREELKDDGFIYASADIKVLNAVPRGKIAAIFTVPDGDPAKPSEEQLIINGPDLALARDTLLFIKIENGRPTIYRQVVALDRKLPVFADIARYYPQKRLVTYEEFLNIVESIKRGPNQAREATATAGMSAAGQPPRQP